MSYKTLLVHIDDGKRSNERVSFALDLALKYDACLIGLYVVCQDLFRPLLKRDDSLILATLEAQHAERAMRAHDRFVTTAQQAGCSFEWRAPQGAARRGGAACSSCRSCDTRARRSGRSGLVCRSRFPRRHGVERGAAGDRAAVCGTDCDVRRECGGGVGR